MEQDPPPVDREILAHYADYDEQSRLSTGRSSSLEFVRSQELILRHIPPAPARVLDVGGGPGVYSLWLAGLGYETHLIDPVQKHVLQAMDASRNQPGNPIASNSIGDARSLSQDDESIDAVLLMGPMYHLTERSDRITALQEAHRVLRPGGPIFVSTVCRFAPLMDGLTTGHIDDPYFVDILRGDLKNGQHRNPRSVPDYFTTAFMHTPDELKTEVNDGGFDLIEMAAIQGPGWLANDFASRWANPERRTLLLELVRAVEHEPAMMGVSQHLMAIGRKPE
ncbi:MAG: methyltransferase domain-containing protein [SAR202 cluster bacterium]|jgi:ubiquinone/menaquinone biosynthesis C-methylase UbiE|nr:methyltransferase domain-containing protein [SAR202 cluster bacterium]MDP6714188.1 methyltransferase domain-containing protein [SAR202 cluster bacterium]